MVVNGNVLVMLVAAYIFPEAVTVAHYNPQNSFHLGYFCKKKKDVCISFTDDDKHHS